MHNDESNPVDKHNNKHGIQNNQERFIWKGDVPETWLNHRDLEAAPLVLGYICWFLSRVDDDSSKRRVGPSRKVATCPGSLRHM